MRHRKASPPDPNFLVALQQVGEGSGGVRPSSPMLAPLNVSRFSGLFSSRERGVPQCTPSEGVTRRVCSWFGLAAAWVGAKSAALSFVFQLGIDLMPDLVRRTKPDRRRPSVQLTHRRNRHIQTDEIIRHRRLVAHDRNNHAVLRHKDHVQSNRRGIHRLRNPLWTVTVENHPFRRRQRGPLHEPRCSSAGFKSNQCDPVRVAISASST
jgi:hypothetical protein